MRKFLGPVYSCLIILLQIPSLQAEESLQSRIDSAQSGAVLELSGRSVGSITISKPIHLKGINQAVIDGEDSGTVITILAKGVVLENLSIINSGESFYGEDSGVRVDSDSVIIRDCTIEKVLFGVFVSRASSTLLENNKLSGKNLTLSKRGDLIRLWYSDYATIRGNQLQGGRDAVIWFSTASVVEGNTFSGGRYGLHFMYASNAHVSKNILLDNSVGAYIMYSQNVTVEGNHFENNRGPSGSGLGMKESDHIQVFENVFIKNRQGLYLDQSPLIAKNVNHVWRNLFAYNDIGIAILPGAKGDIFSENTFYDNLQQVSVRGGGVLSGTLWHQDGLGNFWNDYTGYGAAKSLVGRLPYRMESAFENLMDRFPSTRFFLYTPASGAIEMAGNAFPLFKPKPKFTDPFPLLKPPKRTNIRGPHSQKQAGFEWPLLLLLLSAGLSAFFLQRKRSNLVSSELKNQASVKDQVILVQNVQKSFGPRVVLNNLDLEIKHGESIVLWGANGAGKSTFLKCLLGIQSFGGTIQICGHDVLKDGKKARTHVGYLPQEFTGYDWTVQETLEFICRIRKVDSSVIPSLLKTCRLEGEESKPVPALSGGMKQKLALAQALAGDPDIIILDEPCSNLDMRTRREFLGILHQMKGSRSLLMTSHRVEEIDHLADRVVWMEESQAPKILSVSEFYEEISAQIILWVGLQEEASKPRALELLKQSGYDVSPDGQGIWIESNSSRKMEIVRLLERSNILVRDIREEEKF